VSAGQLFSLMRVLVLGQWRRCGWHTDSLRNALELQEFESQGNTVITDGKGFMDVQIGTGNGRDLNPFVRYEI
jgi:hypothetical protein